MTPMPARPLRARRHHRGFTYLAAMFAVVTLGMAAAATVHFGAVYERRHAEAELLAIGGEFRAALRSYRDKHPSGQQQSGPQRLEDLLNDPRYPYAVRHLRRLYIDPITGQARWGVIRDTDGGIVAVHSLSARQPIRMKHFPPDFFFFDERQRYSDWLFVWGVQCTNSGCLMPDGRLR